MGCHGKDGAFKMKMIALNAFGACAVEGYDNQPACVGIDAKVCTGFLFFITVAALFGARKDSAVATPRQNKSIVSTRVFHIGKLRK